MLRFPMCCSLILPHFGNLLGVKGQWVFLVCGLFLAYSEANGQENRKIELRSSFRPGHNLTVTGFVQQSEWRFQENENIAGFRSREWVPAINLRYSFLISIFGDTGLALGTSMGSFFHSSQLGDSQVPEDQVDPGIDVSFPSLLVGAVQSFGASHRLSFFAEYSALYFPNFIVRTKPASQAGSGSESGSDANVNASKPVRTSILPDTWTFLGQEEFFLSRSFSLVFSFGYRRTMTNCVGGCSPSSFVNSIQFEQDGLIGGVGLNWQAGLVFDE